MIGSGVGGIAGGYISEAIGGRFETGAMIGSIVGGILGGQVYKVYDAKKIADIAKHGSAVVGETMTRVTNKAQEIGAATFKNSKAAQWLYGNGKHGFGGVLSKLGIQVPAFLKDIVGVINDKNTLLELKIKCICGCSKFYIFQNKIDYSDNRKLEDFEKKLNPYRSLSSYFDKKNGKEYLVQRNMFGIITIKIPADEVPSTKIINVIKCKCSKCEKEFIIFDSQKNGYDACVDKPKSSISSMLEFKPIKFKLNPNNAPVEVLIKIINDLTYDEFIDQVGAEFSEEDYSNAFTSIDIYAERDHKKSKIFSMETS